MLILLFERTLLNQDYLIPKLKVDLSLREFGRWIFQKIYKSFENL